MLGHVALDEERADIGIEAAGDEERGQIERRLAESFRLLRDGDRVQVDDGVERIHLVLLGHPAADGADVVAEVLLARRLDPGKDAHWELDYGKASAGDSAPPPAHERRLRARTQGACVSVIRRRPRTEPGSVLQSPEVTAGIAWRGLTRLTSKWLSQDPSGRRPPGARIPRSTSPSGRARSGPRLCAKGSPPCRPSS